MAEDAWVDFVAGWSSGAAAVIVCQPIDTILTRLQAHHAGAAVSTDTRGLVSQSGLRSLWRGSSCMISAVPFQNALLMSGYGLGTRLASENVLWGAFVGGCTGGVIQSFLMSPVELVKVKQQVIGVDLIKTTGEVSRGLLSANVGWKGLGATLWRDGIPHGVWFASYQWCKDTMESKIGGTPRHDSVTIPLTSGAFAATVAWVRSTLYSLLKSCVYMHGNTTDIFLLVFTNIFFIV